MKLQHTITESQLAMYELETHSQVLQNWEVLAIIGMSMIVGAMLLVAAHFMFWRTMQWLANHQE